jgi:ABC-type sugar transport system substrate-binding protein
MLISRSFATFAMAALVAAPILAASPARAERTIQVTNDTDAGFWVMSFDRGAEGRALTYGATSYRVLPGETTQLACAGAKGCDLLLGQSANASAPSFRDVQANCIRVTTFNASRANAAYAACEP